MTIKELNKLPVGTKVMWDENPVDVGVVNQFGMGRREKCISWPDGQTTLDVDDWSLARVSILPMEAAK